MKCPDTDFLVALLRGKNDAKSKIESLDAGGRNATTTINAFIKCHRMTLVTRNVDHFKRIKGLQMERW